MSRNITWNFIGCLHSSQNSFLLCLIHCIKQSWWMYRILPIHLHGWNNGLPATCTILSMWVIKGTYVRVTLTQKVGTNCNISVDSFYLKMCQNVSLRAMPRARCTTILCPLESGDCPLTPVKWSYSWHHNKHITNNTRSNYRQHIWLDHLKTRICEKCNNFGKISEIWRN